MNNRAITHSFMSRLFRKIKLIHDGFGYPNAMCDFLKLEMLKNCSLHYNLTD